MYKERGKLLSNVFFNFFNNQTAFSGMSVCFLPFCRGLFFQFCSVSCFRFLDISTSEYIQTHIHIVFFCPSNIPVILKCRLRSIWHFNYSIYSSFYLDPLKKIFFLFSNFIITQHIKATWKKPPFNFTFICLICRKILKIF